MKTHGWGMRILLGAAGLWMIGFLSACYEHTYTVGSGAPNGALVYDEWQHHWIGGLISPDQEIELREVCPSGDATIHNEVTFLNGLVGALTVGIYEPSTVTIRCRDGRRSDLDLEPGAIESFVLSPDFLDWIAARAPHLLDDAAEAQELALIR